MQYRHLYPMVRLLFPFITGIIIATWLPLSISISWLIPLTLLVCIALFAALPKAGIRFLKSSIFGIGLSMVLLFSGYNLVFSHTEIFNSLHFSHHGNEKSVFIAKVVDIPEEKEHSIKSILKIVGIKSGHSIIETKGKVLVYFAKDSLRKMPRVGDLIVFSTQPAPINKALNPGAFDYQKYMASQNVFHQVFLASFAWKLLEEKHHFNIYVEADKIRKHFIHILESSGLKDKEFAVAAALMLGQKDMLDAETMQSYTGSGVIHILCVSGLHVGVIYLIISTILKIFKKSRKQLYINTVILLVSIWAYALLTGLSPSVMRSAAMFTFITLGNMSNRYVHIINSLAASAFVLLAFNPLLISNIGFQLSYIAILGIVFINPYISSLWSPENKIAAYVWGLIAVSVSAQIATAPLSLYYFHQFPLYFIPANLIAVPLSGIIIYSGLLVLVTSPVAALSKLFGFISYYLILILNFCVSYIEHLPQSVLRINSIRTPEFLLLYLIVICGILIFVFKRKLLIFSILILFIALATSISLIKIKQLKQKQLVVYHVNKQSVIGFIEGNKQTLLAESTVLNDKKIRQYNLRGAEDEFGISESALIARDSIDETKILSDSSTNSYFIGRNLFLFAHKRIAIADSLPKNFTPLRPLQVDYLVLNKNSKFSAKRLFTYYKPSLVIIEPSVSEYRCKKWIADCKNAGINTFEIRTNGAFVANFE